MLNLSDHSFCLYRIPGSSLQLIQGPVRHISSLDELSDKSGWLFHPFQVQSSSPIIFLEGESSHISAEALKDIAKVFRPALPKDKPTPCFSSVQYMQYVEAIRTAIIEGELKKVVAARCATLPIAKDANAMTLLQQLLHHYADAMVYMFYVPGQLLWMGATPELLLHQTGDSFHTYSLAGTIGENEQWSEKEMEEQRIVTSYIGNVLAPLSNSPLSIVERKELRNGHLRHLLTEFSFKAGTQRWSQIVQALHPTPAVGGFEKTAAQNFISKHEGETRSYYSGFAGLTSATSANLYVNLRCMSWHQNTLTFYAGAGITSDSDAQKEWLETENKMDVLRSFL